MASDVDTNLTENNLSSSRTSLCSFTESASKHGPFRATQIWNEIISSLRSQVSTKRRRIKRASYQHCFNGADAVDVILQHLHSDRDSFKKEITRQKAVKLCQLMLENHIFEPVRCKGEDLFDDRPTQFYRFLEVVEQIDDKENNYSANVSAQRCPSCDELSKPEGKMSICHEDSSSLLEEDGVIPNPVVFNPHGQVVQEIMEMTGNWKRRNSVTSLKRKVTPAKLFNVGRPSLPSGGDLSAMSAFRSNSVPPAVEEEVRKEVALSQLLTMIEIPILDDILSYEHPRPTAKRSEVYSNLAFRRFESVTSLFSTDRGNEDSWWDSALDCVESLPRGLDMLDDSMGQETDLSQKLRLYRCIADHYKGLAQPVWSDKFTDIHVGLLNLLMQGKRDVALKALQHAMVLLPCELREELNRLLVFLQHAADDCAIKLSSTETNRARVEKTFSTAIIRNRMLTPHQTGQLVLFMADHATKLWDCPDDVQDVVNMRLRQIASGHTQPRMEKTFCAQVSQSEYHKQQTETTEQALVQMMNTILDDTRLSLRDKKHRLKQLQKHHPQVYWKHFSDML